MDVLEPELWAEELVRFKEADGKLTLGVDEVAGVVGVVVLTDETNGDEDETTDSDDDDPVGARDDDDVADCFDADEELEFKFCLGTSSTRFGVVAASS